MERTHLAAWRADNAHDKKSYSKVREPIDLPTPDSSGQGLRLEDAFSQVSEPGDHGKNSGAGDRRPLFPGTRIADVDHVANQKQADDNAIPDDFPDIAVAEVTLAATSIRPPTYHRQISPKPIPTTRPTGPGLVNVPGASSFKSVLAIVAALTGLYGRAFDRPK